MPYRRNTVGQSISFVAINASTGAAMTGTVGFAAYRVLDNGPQAPATGTVTEKGNGQYSFFLSQDDTNGDECWILFTMTGMIPVEKTFDTTINPTVDEIATAVWTDIFGSDFTMEGSPGHIIVSQLGQSFTDIDSSVFNADALANAPTGASTLTADQIATAVWQDVTSSDFTVTGSIGKSLFNGVTVATNNDKTGYSILLTQSLSSARALDSVADTLLTLNDVFHCAVAGTAGRESVFGDSYTVQTPSTGTTIRTFTLDSGNAPTRRF